MKDLVKSILKIINNINSTIDTNKDINFLYDQNEIEYLMEQCKLLEEDLDNQYFSNLVSDLEDNIEYNTESIYIYNILDSIKKYFNHILI